MKAILGALLCFVFFQSECFALKGGPPYPGGTVVTTGTYAGVFLPDAVQPPQRSGGQVDKNSIGIFTLVFPTAGIGSGRLVIFQTGQTSTGTLQGIVDPKGGVISALINATFPFTEIIQTGVDPTTKQPIFTTESFIAVASGQLNGKTTVLSRITGTADVEFSLSVNDPSRSEVIYDVFGFKQA